jgi:hypothetical protein
MRRRRMQINRNGKQEDIKAKQEDMHVKNYRGSRR